MYVLSLSYAPKVLWIIFNLISSSDEVLYPNAKLVNFIGPVKGSKESNVVGISPKGVNATINGYSIEESREVSLPTANGTGKLIINPIDPKSDIRNGNALSIFIKYKTVWYQ